MLNYFITQIKLIYLRSYVFFILLFHIKIIIYLFIYLIYIHALQIKNPNGVSQRQLTNCLHLQNKHT